MKKPTLILILLLFAVCAAVGYIVASKSEIGGSGNTEVDAETALTSTQQNFILVRVDDLTSSSPKLVEIWIVLTLYSDPPQIMFLPLYPKYDANVNSTLSSAYSINSSGNLSDKLLDKIADEYNITINGYIMVDSNGMDSIASWFGIQGVQASSSPASSDEEIHSILLNSQAFFQNVCLQLKTGGAANQFYSMQWSSLIPEHFQTDLSFEQLIGSWDKVIRSSAPQQCDVLSSE